MKQPQIILHIGTPKTGTTSLQCFLHENQTKLNESKLSYPMIDPFAAKKPEDHSGNAGVIARNLLPDDDQFFYAEAGCKTFYDLLHNHLSSHSGYTTILSSEFFWIPEEAKLKKFSLFLSQFTQNVKVFAYLRRQDSFFESSYQQAVKHGLTHKTYRQFIDHSLKNPSNDYLFVLEKYRKVFGKEKIMLRRFDKRFLFHNDIRNDFLQMLGIDHPTGFSFTSDRNVSLPPHYIKAIRLLNREHKHLRPALLNFYRKVKPPHRQQGFRFPSQLKREIIDFYQESNRKLGFEYLAERDSLFNEEIPETQDEDVDNMTDTDLLALLVDILPILNA